MRMLVLEKCWLAANAIYLSFLGVKHTVVSVNIYGRHCAQYTGVCLVFTGAQNMSKTYIQQKHFVGRKLIFDPEKPVKLAQNI